MIRVELSASDVTIEPGQTAQLAVTVVNNQETDDHVALEIEGIDVEWYAIPVASISIPAGQSGTARVVFKVAREAAASAGTYPFLVRVRGMESGESGVQQATLTVKPFDALQVDLNPKRATSSVLHHANVFDLSVSNQGNHTVSLDLYASDQEDALAYEFDNGRIEVKPGATETVPVLVEPRTRPILGSSRLFQFTVTARSVSDSYVSTGAHGQLERKAVLSTVVAAFVLLVAIVGLGYVLLRPKPVAIRSFAANPMQVVAGDSVTLSWDVANLGEGSYIEPISAPVKSPVDKLVVQPEVPTTYILHARGAGSEQKSSVSIVVTPRPPAAKARIVEFAASQRRIHQGEIVTLSWKVGGAVQLVLNPLGEMNPKMDRSRQVAPDVTTTYVLSAQGSSSDVVTKSVVVTVVPPNVSTAEIVGFRAKPAKVKAGTTATLFWTVDSGTVEIDNGIGGGLQPSGRFDVTPQQTTIYTLRATDSKGNITTRQVTVTVLPPDAPPDELPGGDTGPAVPP